LSHLLRIRDHLSESAHWLQRGLWYTYVFYLITAGTLSVVAALMKEHGVSYPVVLLVLLASILPMHIVSSVVYRMLWLSVPRIAGRYVGMVLRVTRGTVLTTDGQRKILLATSYAALVTLLLGVFGFASAAVSLLLTDRDDGQSLARDVAAVLIETGFLVVIAAIPLLVRYFWLMLGPQRPLAYFESWSCQQTAPTLKRVAKARGITVLETTGLGDYLRQGVVAGGD
jgi:hypothetical protein